MRRRYTDEGFEMDPILYSYTQSIQEFTAPGSSIYCIECWGSPGYGSYGGKGSYVKGDIYLSKDQVLYIYCGGNTSDFNGSIKGGSWGGRSGGSTDVRISNGSWDDTQSLRSRIIVASGESTGGVFYEASNIGPNAGGLIGYDSVSIDASVTSGMYHNTGATQTSGGIVKVQHEPGYNGSFGKGGNCYGNGSIGSGGGSGYYGGAGGGANPVNPETGSTGSCFISGHEGCDAIDSSGSHTGQPNHYSGFIFNNTLMIDGSGYRWTTVKDSLYQMPNPLGGYYNIGIGHNGQGYCRISKI